MSRSATSDLLIRNVRDARGGLVDILCVDGRIRTIGAAVAETSHCAKFDGCGELALPGLVEAHTHLGYSMLGLPWWRNEVGPRLIDKIENERHEIRRLGIDPRLQARRQIIHCAELGSTHVRGHVAIDTDVGLWAVEGVLAARAETLGIANVQIVAFPQSGLLTRPGTLELMDRALAAGADVVGGLDPAGIDRDPKGHVDAIFALAQKHGKPIDIHLHETAELGAFSAELIIERTRTLGMHGKVTISHAFFLGMTDLGYADRLAADLAEANISIMTTGPSGRPCPDVKKLRAMGVVVCSGSDGVRDMWSPYASGDMLERAMLVGLRNNFRRDDEIAEAFEVCTQGGAAALGCSGYGLREGCVADIVLVSAETLAEAVVAHPKRALVVKAGRVIARDGRLAEDALAPQP